MDDQVNPEPDESRQPEIEPHATDTGELQPLGAEGQQQPVAELPQRPPAEEPQPLVADEPAVPPPIDEPLSPPSTGTRPPREASLAERAGLEGGPPPGADLGDIPEVPITSAQERVARRRAEAKVARSSRRRGSAGKFAKPVAVGAAIVAAVALLLFAAIYFDLVGKIGGLFSGTSGPPPKAGSHLATETATGGGKTTSGSASAASSTATDAPSPEDSPTDPVKLAATDYRLPAAVDPETILSAKPKRKLVAITIDDGVPYNPKLFDSLVANDVRATTFVLGSFAADRPDLIKKMNDAGFEIANHSWDHPFLTKLSDADVKSQLRRTQAAISKITGNQAPYLRPPYGDTDKRVKNIAAELGYKQVLWNRSFADTSKSATADQLYKNAMNGLAPGDIILCHWGSEDTYLAMQRIIPEMRRRGFEPVTLSEMLANER
jgi:peptidoglycan/xylan/chitin deacetylase (PgdA/CDA1 family)